MLSLLILILFLALAAWFTLDGYRNGIWYGLVRLTTLAFIFVFAEPIGSLFSGTLEQWEGIPAVVRPYMASLIVGVVLLAIGSGFSNLVRWKTMKLPKEPTPEQTREVQKARMWGMGLGALVGSLIGLLLFVIVWNIGWVAEELHGPKPDAEMTPGYGWGESDDGGPAAYGPQTDDAMARRVIRVKEAIDNSFLGGIIKTVNPVEVEDYELVRDLLDLTKDPVALDKFRQHPDMQEIARHPAVQGLLEDEEIRALVLAKRFDELLRNEKLANVIHDRELLKVVEGTNLREVLRDVKEKSE